MIRPSRTTLKNMELVKEAMHLLALNGVSPKRFVNWLSNNEYFQESFSVWIIEEQNSNREIERATMELQQALSDLSNRYQSSAYMQKIFSSSGFSHDILELITSLRFNSQQPQGQYDHPEFKNYFGDFHKPMSEFEPEPEDEAGDEAKQDPTPEANPENRPQFQTRRRQGEPVGVPEADPSTYNIEDPTFAGVSTPYQFSQQSKSPILTVPEPSSAFTTSLPKRESIQNPYIRNCVFSGEKVRNFNEIRSHIVDFMINGINPDDVIESYHRTLRGRIDESLFRAVGDWLGRQKTNLTNWFAGRGYQGGDVSQELWDQKRDEPIIKSVQDKLSAYENILARHGVLPTEEFAQFATALKQHMKFGQQTREKVAKEIQQKAAQPTAAPQPEKQLSTWDKGMEELKKQQAQPKPTGPTAPTAPTAPTGRTPFQSALAQKTAQDAARLAREKEEEESMYTGVTGESSKIQNKDKKFLESIFGRMNDPKKTWLN